jgi:predicted ATPase/class 3 adenylate cyclase/tRNA A-37 threonylcarbamoyl transferase component Bud32
MITLAGYTLSEQLYESARSIIYRGRRHTDHQAVILKLLKNEYPTPEELARFRREYELTRNLNLDGVIRVYGLEPYQNSLIMILEDFGGESLTRLLQFRSLELREFLEIAIQITDVLGALHHRNIMHKDINPSNIVWNLHRHHIKIIDFGIATALSREQPEIRNPNVLEGTLAYMSPEQTGRMNRAIDYRTDLYSLGATFYHLLTGQLPFQTTDAIELVHCHLAKTPVAPSVVKPEIPPVLSDMILKLMAKTAEGRYQSAYGLKADFQRCLNQLTTTGAIDAFAIARQDVSEKFQVPQKLYGRGQEIETLLMTFERISQGTSEIMLVTGDAGIGKSALVNEIHKPIVAKRGYFIAGQFDQLKRNIPYSSLIQAFQTLMRQILTESEAQIGEWKEKLLHALGSNGQVIVEVISEVELIIGAQPAVPELPPTQAQNRFNLVFQDFVRTFAAADHPLVIFLDDLQWADLPSLHLLELLITASETQYMLLVGAYRNNEVNEAHPLMLRLHDIQKAGVTINTVTLTPLTLEHVSQFIADTVKHSPEDVRSLSEIVFQKTGGNPFFLTQFLQSLYEEEFLKFNIKNGAWEWAMDAIRQMATTANVVELMTKKIQKLPQPTQHVMKLAACIGKRFDLTTLAIVYEHSLTETAHDLWEALIEGLIVPMDESYKYVESVADWKLETGNSPFDFAHHDRHPERSRRVWFKFFHDRIQQAAYSLIEADRKEIVHLHIGRLLLANTPEAEREDKLFEIVNHVNMSQALITNQSEKDQFAQLNLLASKKAKASAAYETAFTYAQAGLALLASECWQQQYDLTLALHTEAAETAYLIGDYDQTARLVAVVLQSAQTLWDKEKIYEIQIQSFIAQNKMSEAIRTGLSMLNLLGIKFPAHPKKFLTPLYGMSTMFTLGRKSPEDLLNLPNMTAPQALAAMRILSSLLTAVYFVASDLAPLFFFKMIKLSVKYGNAPVSAVAYANFGIAFWVMKKFDAGYQFGKLAERLLERFNAAEFKARVLMVVNIFIRHWKEHLKSGLQSLLDGYQSGRETGDLEFATHCAYHYAFTLYLTGRELTEVDREITKFSRVIHEFRQTSIVDHCNVFQQVILNLTGQTDDPTSLSGVFYDEAEMLPIHIEKQAKTMIGTVYFHKMMLCYGFQAYRQAVEYATLVAQYLEAPGMTMIPVFYLYDSLARLAAYPSAFPVEQKQIRRRVAANQKKMKIWAQLAPMNYLHKFYLVEAERARVASDNQHAMDAYDQAIDLAREHEYLNEEALANELASRFYLSQNKEKIAQVYLRAARYCYLRWGAHAKVKDLDAKYPQLLGKTWEQTGITQTATLTAHTTTSTSHTAGTGSDILDLATVMKASQAISGEIVLEKLLAKMMQIVIENAGAQTGILLLEKQGGWFIEAECRVDCPDTKVLQSLPITSPEAYADPLLPTAVVNYVARTKSPIVLHNAVQEGAFAHDPYITRQQPKSVLCLPLVNQGKLTGILYLENNLTTDAFTADRVEVLKVLSSQMAIAIENALLYKNLENALQHQVELTTAYSRFVPREFLSFLNKENIVEVQLGDQVEKEMTVLFSDIRGFTTLSEHMTPQQNFKFINSYLSRMEPWIHHYHGFIDKYIGDAIMALFPTNADDAVQAAIAMLRELREYNQGRKNAGYQPIRIGIGVNTGSLMLGTVGGLNRMDGTVISDAVNLASRLEGLTKMYGASIVIGEQTLSQLKETTVYHARFLGKVQVKGKTKPVAVFEVYDGDAEEVRTLKQQTVADFEEGLRCYYAQDFTTAVACFQRVLQTSPNDKAAELYLMRATSLRTQTIPPDWDGVEALEHK